MSIDPGNIELTPEQKERIAAKAECLGVDSTILLDELLGISSKQDPAINGLEPKSMLEAMRALGAWGCIEGPGDLATNPKYMEGFGTNANGRTNSD